MNGRVAEYWSFVVLLLVGFVAGTRLKELGVFGIQLDCGVWPCLGNVLLLLRRSPQRLLSSVCDNLRGS